MTAAPKFTGPEHESTPIYEGWTVDHGWGGPFYYEQRGPIHARRQVLVGYGSKWDGKPGAPGSKVVAEFAVTPEMAFWRVEIVRSRSDARWIWSHEAEITKALADRGIQHARLSVKVETDGSLQVRDYDRTDGFSFTIEATR